MRLDAIKLQATINRMEELYREILDDLFERQKFNTEIIDEYKKLKKEILLSLFEEPIHHTEDKYFPDVRNALQKLTLNGDPFFEVKASGVKNIDELIKAFREVLDIDLSDEIDQLASDEFYSWFSGEDYVHEKIRGQLLILQAERLPQFLSDFVQEIRECFIFQQYIAAFVLCRTIFEISIRDVVKKRDLLSDSSPDSDYVKDYLDQLREKHNGTIKMYMPTLAEYIVLLSLVPAFKNFKIGMDHIRAEGNRVIHANKTVTREECQDMIKHTFRMIHDIYEKC